MNTNHHRKFWVHKEQTNTQYTTKRSHLLIKSIVVVIWKGLACSLNKLCFMPAKINDTKSSTFSHNTKCIHLFQNQCLKGNKEGERNEILKARPGGTRQILPATWVATTQTLVTKGECKENCKLERVRRSTFLFSMVGTLLVCVHVTPETNQP